MSDTLKIIRTVSDLRRQIMTWRQRRESVALVPTMGALHEGHKSLIRQAGEKADRVCVSLFVNPRQFGPAEDFGIYPRDETRDAECLRELSTDMLYAPNVDEIYPQGHSTSVQVGPIGDILEGEHRPGFFTGVVTVVCKLLLQVQPDLAIFGEKDFQQLQVIRKAVADLDIPVDILGGETIREADGLALSSRNVFLSAQERAIAPKLYATLQQIAEAVKSGTDIDHATNIAQSDLEAAGFGLFDYLTVRDAVTLLPVTAVENDCRILVAAKLGQTRLIDNIAI